MGGVWRFLFIFRVALYPGGGRMWLIYQIAAQRLIFPTASCAAFQECFFNQNWLLLEVSYQSQCADVQMLYISTLWICFPYCNYIQFFPPPYCF
uniref:Uncharacterized protein n=1 Tax=Anguilla anguilla TaxID=7936 RepID=A0A0E9W392_ANGAN